MPKEFFLFFLIIILLFCSGFSDFTENGGRRQYLGSVSLFNQDLKTWVSSSRPASIFRNLPLIADLDNDNVNEVINFYSNTIGVYSSDGFLIPITSYTLPTNKVFSNLVIYDLDKDNISEMIIGGSTTKQIYILRYNVSTQLINLVANRSIVYGSSSGKDTDLQLGCFQNTYLSRRFCVLFFSEPYFVSGGTRLHAIVFNTSNQYDSKINPSVGSSDFYCSPIISNVEIADYDTDNIPELIFNVARIQGTTTDVFVNTFYVYVNGTNYAQNSKNPIAKQIVDRNAGIFNCSQFGIKNKFSSPSVFNFEGGGQLETIFAYVTTNGDDTEAIKYDASGSSENFPSVSTVDGDSVSNIAKGSFFYDTVQNTDFCYGTYDKSIAIYSLICGSKNHGSSPWTTINYDTYVYSLNVPFNSSSTSIMSIDVNNDGYSEIASVYGILKPEHASLSFAGNGNFSILWDNPVTNCNCSFITCDAQKFDREDLLMINNLNLWYFDDAINYRNPSIDSVTINPCLESVWKINTTVGVQVKVSVPDANVNVRSKAILYYNSVYQLNSSWSDFANSGTIFSFNFVANQTMGTGFLRVIGQSSTNLSVVKDYSFSVGLSGVVYGECFTSQIPQVDITNVTLPISVLQPNLLNNSLVNAIKNVDQKFHLGLGLTIFWLVIMVVVGVVCWSYGGYSKTNPSLIVGIVVFFEFLLLVIGAKLGFISVGIMVAVVVVSLVAIGFWVRSWITGTGD